ncbi:MAG: hypothetical protein IJ661_06500 [Lachnospiraceae bacterium]|nr:hypothetical protein [Lachnospiraceae bacterium]
MDMVLSGKKSKLFAAVFMSVTLLVSGCGKTDVVKDYGYQQETDEGRENDTGSDGAAENASGTDDSATAQSIGKSGLQGKLGTDKLVWEREFDVGGKSISVDASYDVPEIGKLGAYRIEKVSVGSSREETVVKNVLGDTAKKLDKLSDVDSYLVDAGDAYHRDSWIESIYDQIMLIDHYDLALSESEGDSDNEGSDPDAYPEHRDTTIPDLPGQLDRVTDDGEDWYYIHCYTGKLNGIDYALVYGYSYFIEREYIAFAPLAPGEYIGNSEINTMFTDFTFEGDEENADGADNDGSGDIISGITNEYNAEDNTLIESAEKFLSDTLGISSYEGDISFNQADMVLNGMFMGESTIGRTEMVFCTEIEDKEGFDNILKDGYEVYLNGRFQGVPVAKITNDFNGYSEGSAEYNMNNSGSVCITSKGVYSVDIARQFDVKEILSDDVPLISADNVLDCFEAAMPEAVKNEKYTDKKSMRFDRITFVYYPVESPEKNGEYTYIPAWAFTGHDQMSTLYSTVYINAMDGSFAGVE